MKRAISATLLLFCVTFFLEAYAQTRLYTDIQGNIYEIKPDNEILRLDTSGKVIANWRDRNLGRIASFDLLNPLKPLAFYSETATLVEFDNNLYPVNQRFVEEARNAANPLFCRSADNRIWFFDDRNLSFHKYDSEGLNNTEGPRLNQHFPSSFQAIELIEHQRQLFLVLQNEGVWVFDFYGAFIRKIAAKGVLDIALSGTELWILLPGKIQQFGLKSLQVKEWLLSDIENPESIAPAPNGLYFLRQGQVTLWPLSLN